MNCALRKLFSFHSAQFNGLRKAHWLKISEEVKCSIENHKPVVALESTVITHGLPFPHNLKIAQELEAIVRENHCTPATVALFNGAVHVGLNDQQINQLATTEHALKVSRRDMAAILVKKSIGSTTVSATMIAAHLAGIPVFATGGIGGVHRGVEQSFDVSADLTELGRTAVTVVCAGVKSILDVPKTLEYLETEGVPVITFGDTDDFPGFFTRKSGCKSPLHFDNELDIAKIIKQSEEMQMSNGILVAVPIPNQEANDGELIENAIKTALDDARHSAIKGKHLTPFVLKRINELTKGLSLTLTCKIAKALAHLKQKKSYGHDDDHTVAGIDCPAPPAPDVVSVGGTIVDFYVQTNEEFSMDGSTLIGTVNPVCGGVGRNHADALTRLGMKSLLISAAGSKDNLNVIIEKSCNHMDLRGIEWVPHAQTACYAGITSNGALLQGVGSMEVFFHVTPDLISKFQLEISKAKLCVLDGNVSVETIASVCDICARFKVPVWFDPADSSKVQKIFLADCWHKISCFSPNWNEFLAMMKYFDVHLDKLLWKDKSSLYEQLISNIPKIISPSLDAIVLTLGEAGLLLISRINKNQWSIIHYEKPSVPEVLNVSGAGDCLNSGVIYGLLNNMSWHESISLGLQCASASLQSVHAVPSSLSSLVTSYVAPAHIQFESLFSI